MQQHRIPLRARDGSVRAYVTVDPGDYETLAQHRWSLTSTGYAYRTIQFQGRPVTVKMHRVIVGLPPRGDRREVDHFDGDPLNNRRENLRIVTRQQQLQNVPARGGTSRHRGVSYDSARGKWLARCGRRGLGRFETEAEAVQVVTAYRLEQLPFTNEARSVV